MARDDMKMKVSITFDAKETLKDLRNTLKQVSNASDFDIKIDNKNIKKLNTDIIDIVNNINKVSSTSTTFKVDDTGLTKATKSISTIKDELGNTIKVTQDLEKGLSTVTTSGNFEKKEKELQKFNDRIKQMKSDLKIFSDNGIIKPDTLDKINTRIDKLSFADSSKKDIDDVQDRINRLAGSESGIVKFRTLISNIKNEMLSIKDTGDLGKVDNKSIDEYNKNLKEAEKILDKLRNNSPNLTSGKVSEVIGNLNGSFGDIKSQVNDINKVESKVGDLQTKLNSIKSSKLLDDNVINQLQQRLDSINTNNASKEMKELKADIDNLSKSSSQIVKLENAIGKGENNLNGLKGKYGSLVGDSNSINELEKYKSNIENLKTLKSELQNGKIIDGNVIASEINNANNSFGELKTSVINSNNAFKLGSQEAMSFGESIQRALGNVGIYMSVASACRYMMTALKGATDYVKFLDESFTDMKMTMNLSVEDFNKMTSQLDTMSEKLGVSSKDMHDISRVLANSNETTQSVLDKTAGMGKLSNISGMSGDETTKAIQSITQQFKLLDDQGNITGKNVEHVGDVLTAVSKSMKMDFGEGIKELTSAVKEAGSVAESGGMSLEKYNAIIGATMQQTGKTGSEIAGMYKMFQARTFQQKSLTEELGVNEDDLSNAAKALKSVGMELKDGTVGGLKDTGEVIAKLQEKWGGLTDAAKQYLGYNLVGTRQMSLFEAMMNSATEQQKLYNEAINAQGALEEANKVKAESIEGKTNTMEDKLRSLGSKIVNSDEIKTGIDAVSNLADGLGFVIDKFGLLPTVIGTTVAALNLFSDRFRNSFSNQLPIMSQMNKGFDALRTKLGIETTTTQTNTIAKQQNTSAEKVNSQAKQQNAISNQTEANSERESQIATNADSGAKIANATATTGATIATKALSVAITGLQSVMTFGLGMALTWGITKLVEWAGNVGNAKEKLKEFNEESKNSLTNNQQLITSADSYIKQIEELKKQLTNTVNIDERKDIQKQIEDAQKSLASLDSGFVSDVDENGTAFAKNLDLVREKIELKKEEMKVTAEAFMKENKGLEDEINSLEERRNKLKEYQNAKANGTTEITEGSGMFDSYTGEELTKTTKIEDKIKELQDGIKDTTDRMGDASLMAKYLGDDVPEQYKKIVDSIDDYNKSLEEARNEEERLKNEAVDNAMITNNANMKLLSSSIDEFNQNGELSASTIEKISNAFPELNADDQSISIKNLTDKLKELVDAENATDLSAGDKLYGLTSALNELTETGQLTGESIRNLAQILPDLKLANMSTEEKVRALTDAINEQNEAIKKESQDGIKDAQKSLKESVDVYEKITKYQKQLSENGGRITSGLLGEFVDKNGAFQDFMGNPEDINEVTEYFNNKMKEVASNHAESMDVLKGNSESYFQQVQSSGDFTNEKIREWASNFMDLNKEGYDYDLGNYKNMNEAKASLLGMLKSTYAKACSEMTGISVEQYEKDFSNYRTIAEAKQGIIAQLLKATATYLSQLLGGSADTYQKDLQNCKTVAEQKEYLQIKLNQRLEELDKARLATMAHMRDIEMKMNRDSVADQDQAQAEKLYRNNQNKLQNYEQQIKNIQTNYDSVIKKLDIPNLDRNLDSLKDLSNIDPNNGKKEKQKKEKTISLITTEIDRWHDLKEAIKEYQIQLDKEKDTIYNKSQQEKIDSLNRQISLYDKLKQKNEALRSAQTGRLNELRGVLASKGFTFDSDGAMTNYTNKLKALEDMFNAQIRANPDIAKTNKEQFDSIKKLVDEYSNLYESEIPNAIKAISSADKSLIDTRKELFSMYTSLESEVSKATSKYIKDRISLIDKLREALEKQHNEEKKGEKTAKNQEDLIELKRKMDLVKGVNDKKYKDLKKQYDELMNSSNEEIREDVYDKELEKFDNQKKKWEEIADNKDAMTKIVQEAINTGQIKILGETKSLYEEIVELNNEENIGVQTRLESMQQYNETLKEGLAIRSQINQLDNQLGYSQYNNLVQPKNSNINAGNNVFNFGNGITDKRVVDICNKVMNEAINKISSQLKPLGY